MTSDPTSRCMRWECELLSRAQVTDQSLMSSTAHTPLSWPTFRTIMPFTLPTRHTTATSSWMSRDNALQNNYRYNPPRVGYSRRRSNYYNANLVPLPRYAKWKSHWTWLHSTWTTPSMILLNTKLKQWNSKDKWWRLTSTSTTSLHTVSSLSCAYWTTTTMLTSWWLKIKWAEVNLLDRMLSFKDYQIQEKWSPAHGTFEEPSFKKTASTQCHTASIQEQLPCKCNHCGKIEHPQEESFELHPNLLEEFRARRKAKKEEERNDTQHELRNTIRVL